MCANAKVGRRVWARAGSKVPITGSQGTGRDDEAGAEEVMGQSREAFPAVCNGGYG